METVEKVNCGRCGKEIAINEFGKNSCGPNRSAWCSHCKKAYSGVALGQLITKKMQEAMACLNF